MSRQITTIFDKVVALLEKDTIYRDSDEKLVLRIWQNELKDKGIDSRTYPTYDFFMLFMNGEITSADSITRARRRATQMHPRLRGKTYNERKADAEEAKNEIMALGSYINLNKI